MYLYTYINAHVQHLIYWQGQCVCDALVSFVEPYLHRDMDYSIGSNFWKFYFLKTSFFGESV
jgi:hypothetical protein